MEEEKQRLLINHRKLSRRWAKFNCKDNQNQSLKIIEMESAPDLTKKYIPPPIIPISVSSPDLSSDPEASICDFKAYKEKNIQAQKDASYGAPENDQTGSQGDVPYLNIEIPLRNNYMLAMLGTLNNESALEIPENFPQEKSTQSQENINNLFRENQKASKLQEDIKKLETATPLRHNCLSGILGPSNNSKFLTPLKESKLAVPGTSNNDIFLTPLNKLMIAVPGTSNSDIFLTPLTELQTITPIFKIPRKSMSKNKQKYQNMISPVATYIKKSPHVVPGTSNSDIFLTPLTELQTITPIFKIPRKSMSKNKQKYQNMISPVATYIKKSPHVPLFRDICPREPLPGLSCKQVKCSRPNKGTKECLRPNKGNKENMKADKQEKSRIPTARYKCANETRTTKESLRPNKGKNESLRPNEGNKENMKGDEHEKNQLSTACYKSAKETRTTKEFKESLRPNKGEKENLRPNKGKKESLRPNEGNKENMKGDKQGKIQLPKACYKSAKETKMIHIPDVGKMPQNQWAKRVESSIPKATVIKHQLREVNSGKKPLLQNQDDSCADLSLHQADVSICTKKSAFKKL